MASAEEGDRLRVATVGGMVGPTTFIAAWVGAGFMAEGYSSVQMAISRLAAEGAPTRATMTAGFLAFGVGVPAYSLALRRSLPGPAWVAAAASGLATVGVALTPLEHSARVDSLHAVMATTGYVTLALTPLLAAKPLRQGGLRRSAAASVAVGVVAAACLAATSSGPWKGAFQRTGLTILDLWIIATATALARGRLRGTSSGS